MNNLYELSSSDLEEIMRIGREAPDSWIEIALGVDMWSTQAEIARSVRDNRNTLVDSCHGIGKTMTLACVALDFLYSYPGSRVITTAPTFRQVQSILWSEIHLRHNDAPFELGGTLNQVELKIAEGWYCHGLSTNKPERFQGQHAPYILFIVDEAYGVARPIFEAIRGGMSSGFVRLLCVGNPTDPSAYVVEAARKTNDKGRSTWNHIAISAFDTPNFTELGITIEDIRSNEWREKQDAYLRAHGGLLPRPYLINPDFVAEMYIEFGEESPAWQARVLGQLPSESSNAVIPLAWVEAAMLRWETSREVDGLKADGKPVSQELLDSYVPLGQPEELGVDVARMGDDETVIAHRRGRRVTHLVAHRKNDLYDVTGLVDAEHTYMINLVDPLTEADIQDGVKRDRLRLIKIDSNGMGAGVMDNLAHMGRRVIGVNVSEKPRNQRKFEDRTTELWWSLRELLHPMSQTPMALPRDMRLLGELSGRRYRVSKDNKIQVESKDDFKKRLQRSPDRADAVVLACADLAPSMIESW